MGWFLIDSARLRVEVYGGNASTAVSHLNVWVRNCHREEGALRLTRRCER